MEKINIIIPAYNEEKRIGKTLEEYGKFFTSLKNAKKIDATVLIVINNTTDKTKQIVQKYAKKYTLIKFLEFIEGGKGFAITQGFKESIKSKSNPHLIGFVDADMATSPEAFYELLLNMGDFDGIIASRYIRGAIVNPKQTWERVVVSRIFNFLIRIIFFMNYRDTQCGAKIFKSAVLKKVISSLGTTKWAYDVDLLYQMKRNGFKIREFPTIWQDKKYSKINIKKSGTNMVLGIIRLRLLYSPFKKLIKVYDKIFGGFSG